ncbi:MULTISPECIES: DUF4124 domain-containing protein [unclassified Shewanella]|uniref:DUF4124 domain-containing protein n=1 Tax=unclassified Shewanella TaxID=196818 RepID=UPI001BBDE121|nr:MULTISPECIES: DUF4124 domain-containing protein [unclassified Shewanella]GIU21568.1 hypothetical protein TUM4444_41080 [Shewanella sp. MBTL60-112-B1]GIU24854.1 hypothetical protein TUM4445_02440 [Shewanella sp. MBTL60-112-B2]
MIKTIKTGYAKLLFPTYTATLASTFLLLAVSSSSAQANIIYTWVDDSGVTHYSQQPPEQRENQANTDKLYSEDLNPKQIGTVAPSSPVTQVQAQTDLEKKAAAINQADSEQAKQICKNARHSLNVLTTHAKLNKKNKQTGEMVAMTEEQRQASISEQKERVKLFCTK